MSYADLSTQHYPLTELFDYQSNEAAARLNRLTNEQTAFYEENGYLAGVRLLTDEQVEVLRGEIEDLAAATGASRELFYEYNSNESTDPSRVLFHALGAWRVTPGFHDLLWNPAFLFPPCSCSKEPSVSGTIRSSISRRTMAAWWPGTRIIPIGRGRNRWRISPAGSDSTIRLAKTDACITFPAAIAGICFPSPGSQTI